MKLLIVDNEERARKTIHQLVKWEEYGIEEVLEADNGLTAKDIIARERPQIILMDMMMPQMNGVELMKWVHEHEPAIKFVVISGHDDFDFVRSTMRYGGIDYLLKPVEAKVLSAALSKAVTASLREQQERQIRERQQPQGSRFMPMYADKLLSGLVADPAQHESTMRMLRDECGLPESFDTAAVAILQVEETDYKLFQRFGNDADLLYFALLNICNEFLQPRQLGTAFRHPGEAGEITLMVWDSKMSLTVLINEINEGLYTTLQRRMHFGISRRGAFPGEVPQLYVQAVEALRSRNLLESDSYVHHAGQSEDGHGGDSGTPLFDTYAKDWELAVTSGQHELIAMAVEAWIGKLKKCQQITLAQLEEWDAAITRLQERMLEHTAGAKAPELQAQLELEQRTYAASQPASTGFSLLALQDRWQRMLIRLSQKLLTHQRQQR
ncbi:response regulator [Paenibacillus sp. 1P07SE]|uniref:response regulator n=1 Tax=Paenibacillus sp. 1P07SE TaxID=3132209 RepID=UPI0039A4BE00